MDADEIIYLEFRYSLAYATGVHEPYIHYIYSTQERMIVWAAHRANLDVRYEIAQRGVHERSAKEHG